MIEQLQAYIRGETSEFSDFIEHGWVTEAGEVTERGQEVSGYRFDDIHFLVLGSDVFVAGLLIAKGTELMLVWADRSNRDRRKWVYTVAIKSEEGKIYRLPILHSPRHEVISKRLPLDIHSETE